jgi:hypothetical protein
MRVSDVNIYKKGSFSVVSNRPLTHNTNDFTLSKIKLALNNYELKISGIVINNYYLQFL